ncbi:MAG: DNA-binding protein [Gammaproteobacteria bacterium]|nr:DNA-binding protein [Gammaproteobacteria bacterium]NIV48405.1 DNA-binding protein [Gammaproteobacteria bacterium]NIW56036.1 DNA-binding protein [Gammaproteobacteria bacterium]NIX05007.1 DNA-binding protein [Gammaproteobacteria bacterium]
MALSTSTGNGGSHSAIATKQTKAQVLESLSHETGLPRSQIQNVLSALSDLAKRHMMASGSGEFVVPDVGVKIRRVHRKARTARNPITGESIAVPAKTAVKATVLKSLKDAVN